MRWEALFADLEGQLTAAEASELDAEVRDRVRREVARLRLADRGRAAVGAAVTIGTGAAGVVTGTLLRAGADWWLVSAAPAVDQLVSLRAVTWVTGLRPAASDPESVSVVEERLGLAHALRGIARDRSPVTLLLRDGTVVSGTIDRVGADFVDVTEHPPGEARPASGGRVTRTVTFEGLAVVRPA